MNHLRRYRREQGLTQVQVGDILGVDQCTVSHHEIGRKMPSADQLARYARLYKCRMDDLYTIESEEAVAS